MHFVNPLNMWLSGRQLGSCTCFCIWSLVMLPPENSSTLVRGEGEARPGLAWPPLGVLKVILTSPMGWVLPWAHEVSQSWGSKQKAPQWRHRCGGLGCWVLSRACPAASSLVKRRSAMQGRIGPVADPWWCVSEALNAQVWSS